MRKIILLFTVLLFVASCNSSIEGEGAATAKQEFATDDFSNLEVDCNCDLTLIPSEDTKVVVESHQNLIDNLEINSKRKTLKIKEKSNVEKYGLYNVNVYINPNLNRITLGKTTKMKFSGTLQREKLRIDVNDYSAINETHLQDVRNLELNISKNTVVNLDGTVVNLSINSSDKARADLSNLTTVDIDFKAKGESALNLYPLKSLKGIAVDHAEVYYRGEPKKDTTEKDKAKIQQKN